MDVAVHGSILLYIVCSVHNFVVVCLTRTESDDVMNLYTFATTIDSFMLEVVILLNNSKSRSPGFW